MLGKTTALKFLKSRLALCLFTAAITLWVSPIIYLHDVSKYKREMDLSQAYSTFSKFSSKSLRADFPESSKANLESQTMNQATVLKDSQIGVAKITTAQAAHLGNVSNKKLSLTSKNITRKLSKPFVYMFGETPVKVQGSIPATSSPLFIGIHSGPKMKERRDSIRETYLTEKLNTVEYAFILGFSNTELLRENAVHKDIVFINQTDRYTALDSVLPYKAASIIHITSRMNPQPEWMLKTDDDSYINLPEVMKKLPELKEDQYYGHCFQHGKPIRNKKSKWYVSQDFWPDNTTYPPNCVGAGYFMSRKAYNCAAKVLSSPSHKYFPREDVTSAMYMQACDIQAVGLPGVSNNSKTKAGLQFLVKHYIKNRISFQKEWNGLHSKDKLPEQSDKETYNSYKMKKKRSRDKAIHALPNKWRKNLNTDEHIKWMTRPLHS